MSKSSSDRLAALASVLLSVPEEELRRLDFDNMNLGSFVKQYAGSPNPVDFQSRSSIREDTPVALVRRLLSENNGETIHVLDACCGEANLAKMLLHSIRDESSRVAYWAVDRDNVCIESIDANESEFSQFESMNTMIRDICDMSGFPEPMDLISLTNSLHEIPPRFFPRMFRKLNSLVHPTRGRICIVDMEELPESEPESIAITWSSQEIDGILKAAGFSPAVTRHPKSVPVYQVLLQHSSRGVNELAMKQEIEVLIRKRMGLEIKRRQKAKASIAAGHDKYREWLVATGCVARCAEELVAIGAGK